MKKAIIFDIDGTVCYHTNRSPFDWSDLSGDKVIANTNKLIEALYLYGYDILFVTGRPERVREQTQKWIEDNLCTCSFKLYMKEGNEYEKGFIAKEAILNEIQQDYDVEFVFDDDTKCANMYVKNNIITFNPLNYKYNG